MGDRMRELPKGCSADRIQHSRFAVLASIRRRIGPTLLALVAWPLVVTGCGLDLRAEFLGVLVEEVNFGVQFELTGQPVCQGPPTRCGPPGLFALIIPDCPLGVVCFSEACNEHDRCYGRCGSSKVVCDDLFLDDLLDSCSEATFQDDETHERCLALANIYWQAVARFGQLAFDISQDVNCGCLGISPNPASASKQFSTASREFYPYDDLDDDLMPDVWEREVGLDADRAADAGEDPDRDGILNLEEFILGTDPFTPDRPASRFHRHHPRCDGA